MPKVTSKKGKRKATTVWLYPRQIKMLKEMPEVSIGNIARDAIEDLFEGRKDRDYARIYIEEDLKDLFLVWEKRLGTKNAFSLTSTKDGFRVVLTVLKDYDA